MPFVCLNVLLLCITWFIAVSLRLLSLLRINPRPQPCGLNIQSAVTTRHAINILVLLGVILYKMFRLLIYLVVSDTECDILYQIMHVL
jgi:hypothetical protein